jgi:hypothetical protein
MHSASEATASQDTDAVLSQYGSDLSHAFPGMMPNPITGQKEVKA